MKKIVTTVATGVTMAALATSTAFAWTYNMTGSGACQPDGSYKVTWTVDNSSEDQPFHIRNSSNESVVPLGDVPARDVKSYSQTVDGKTPATYDLTIKGNWDGDRTLQERSATVKLETPCEQPGGRGGDTPETPQTPSTTQAQAPAAVAPAVVPVGAVNAGDGGAASSLNLAAVTGLVASAAAVIFGIVRRVVQKG